MRKRVVLIIQCRIGSTRLPGKSVMDLAGEPMLGRIIERIRRCINIDEVVLAIPDTKEDLILKDIGIRYGVNVFRGNENDLVDRYYQAAINYNAEIVVRFPADNAVPEPSEIDRIINHHLSLSTRGFSSNLAEINGSGYPDGIGAEVFDFSLLAEVWHQNTNLNQREHVHLNFFNYELNEAVDLKWCPIYTLNCPSAFKRPDLVLDVNTIEQYQFMRQLYEYLYPKNPNFNIVDIIHWYDHQYVKKN